METVIDVKDLTVKFGSFTAVNKITLQIAAGEIFGFLGPNGSGKSTTIRVLCGILQPYAGRCSVLGYDILTEAELVKKNIGYMSQKFSLYHDLTVKENLEFYAGLYGIERSRKQSCIQEMLSLSGLEHKQHLLTADLSSGVRQRLALGCAIMHRPRLLFLDEPTSGVDPKSRKLFWQIIYRLARTGTTILVTTHFMDEAEHCDKVALIQQGELTACASPQQLKQDIPGVLVNIAGGKSAFSLLQSLKKQKIKVSDAYLCGNNVRLLLPEGDLWQLKDIAYEVILPSMEDVFIYHVRKRKEESL